MVLVGAIKKHSIIMALVGAIKKHSIIMALVGAIKKHTITITNLFKVKTPLCVQLTLQLKYT